MATTFTEGKHTAEFLLSEANGYLSREQIVIDSSAPALQPGTVLGKMASGRYKAYSNANSAGDADAAAGILYAYVADSTGNQNAVMIARSAEVSASMLTGLDSAARADMAVNQIIFR